MNTKREQEIQAIKSMLGKCYKRSFSLDELSKHEITHVYVMTISLYTYIDSAIIQEDIEGGVK